MAFVVVLHLSPDHESMLAELLQRATKLRVQQVTDAVTMEADTVYVVPPRKILEVHDGAIALAPLPPDRQQHVAVDLLFRTLADSHGTRATAIVLSGADGDGAIGIKRIKERGGLTIAQDPGEAYASGMPGSAIATGMIDWVLPAAQMAARVMEYHRMAPGCTWRRRTAPNRRHRAAMLPMTRPHCAKFSRSCATAPVAISATTSAPRSCGGSGAACR